jgi:uncharacterized protein YbaR (Trm112 family)
MNNHTYCPQCQAQLLEYLVEQGIALACPVCRKIYRITEYVARSPAFPNNVRREAREIANLAWAIGLLALGGILLAAIFDGHKRRR